MDEKKEGCPARKAYRLAGGIIEEVSPSALSDGVMATAEHFRRMNKKLAALSDEQAAELLDKVFNEHECVPADEAFMKQIADLVEGVEL